MYYDRDFYILVWSMYGWKSLLFLGWMGSKHQFCIILRVLHYETFQDRLWKIQNKNCAMGSVGSTIIALIAVTSLLLPYADKTHWTARTLWIFSMLSAFLSVAFSCKHQRFIGNLLLSDEKNLWDLKRHLHDGKKKDPAKPRLGVVWLLSGTAMFFDISLMLYVVGLAVYLGSIYKHNIDPDTERSDSRLIFILSLLFAALCFCIYWVLDFLSKTGRHLGWSCHRMWYEAKIPPNLGGCERRICNPREVDDQHEEEEASLLSNVGDPGLQKLPLFWRPPRYEVSEHKSYCRQRRECAGGECAWPRAVEPNAPEEILASAILSESNGSIAAI